MIIMFTFLMKELGIKRLRSVRQLFIRSRRQKNPKNLKFKKNNNNPLHTNHHLMIMIRSLM
ncbi:hypothetical protein DERP_008343 [Dermatophagoides pteronyssinus]|uniref:Uncharacterized protein n=1 Tax=Dermatophagoides pteronyssinus TaxID=6956 RepID=A0ABQ8J698_DERPT|nr:hypothetical protein DERP_008343 [Dermatophagoides pteronyssinus]